MSKTEAKQLREWARRYNVGRRDLGRLVHDLKSEIPASFQLKLDGEGQLYYDTPVGAEVVGHITDAQKHTKYC